MKAEKKVTDFGETLIGKTFEVPQIPLQQVIGTRVLILDYKEYHSKFSQGSSYMYVKVEKADGEEVCFIVTGEILKSQIRKSVKYFPLSAVVERRLSGYGRHYLSLS